MMAIQVILEIAWDPLVVCLLLCSPLSCDDLGQSFQLPDKTVRHTVAGAVQYSTVQYNTMLYTTLYYTNTRMCTHTHTPYTQTYTYFCFTAIYIYMYVCVCIYIVCVWCV